MHWWIKARRAHTHLALATVLFGLLLAMAGNQTVLLPSLTNGATASARLALFVPVVVTATLMFCMESRLYAPEASGTRWATALDAALVIAVMIVCAAIGYAVGQPAAGRNLLFLTGLMLTMRAVAGKAAVMAPIAWLLAVLFIGYRTADDPYPWAVVPEQADALYATTAAFAMFAIGISCLLRTPRNPE